MDLVNGQAASSISIHDRGLLYGDGLFETIAVRAGRPQLWERHLRRLSLGCTRLNIALPAPDLLYREALQAGEGVEQGVLKLMITRGSGGRGYRAPGEGAATRILSLHPWPAYPDHYKHDGVAVRICETRLAGNPALAGLKHLNRLEQVLARREWADETIAEGLVLDRAGQVIEGTMSNLFMVHHGVAYTPDLSECGVAGIMRELILETCAEWSTATRISHFDLDTLMAAQEIFLCNSVIGVWPVREVAGTAFPVGPLTRRIAAYIDTQEAT